MLALTKKTPATESFWYLRPAGPGVYSRKGVVQGRRVEWGEIDPVRLVVGRA